MPETLRHPEEHFRGKETASEHPAAPEKLGEDVTVRYIFCGHPQTAPENVISQIAEAAGDCDVVAVETVGDSYSKLSFLREANRSSQEGDEAMLSPGFHKSLADALRDTGKTIRVIDATTGGPGSEEIWRSKHSLTELFKHLYSAEPEKLEGLMDEVIADVASSNSAREQVVNGQLTDIISQLPSGSKLGVVEGAVHTPTSYAPHGARQERVFLQDHGKERFLYSPLLEAFRTKEHQPDEPLEPRIKKECLVEMYIQQDQETDFEAKNEASLSLRDLDDEKLGYILEDIHKLCGIERSAKASKRRVDEYLRWRLDIPVSEEVGEGQRAASA